MSIKRGALIAVTAVIVSFIGTACAESGSSVGGSLSGGMYAGVTATELAQILGGINVEPHEEPYTDTAAYFAVPSMGNNLIAVTFVNRENRDHYVAMATGYDSNFRAVSAGLWAVVTDDVRTAFAVQDRIGGEVLGGGSE
jgi:hypothetical protein